MLGQDVAPPGTVVTAFSMYDLPGMLCHIPEFCGIDVLNAALVLHAMLRLRQGMCWSSYSTGDSKTLHGGMGAGGSALTVMVTVGGTSLRFGTIHLQSAIRLPGQCQYTSNRGRQL